MKPFDNVAISSTEPKNKAEVWIQHSRNILKFKDWNYTQSGITATIKDNKIKLKGTATAGTSIYIGDVSNIKELNNEIINRIITVSATNISNFSLNFTTSDNLYYIQLTDSILKSTKKIDTSIRNIAVYIQANKTIDVEFGIQIEYGENAKNYELPIEDDILVEDGVYNSVLTKKISTGIEIKTNKKIDGKDIYYKRIDLGTGPTSTSKTYPIGINFNNIIDSNVFAKDSTASFKLPFLAQSSQEFINYYFQSTNIIIQAGKDRSGYNFYLDIYYIK